MLFATPANLVLRKGTFVYKVCFFKQGFVDRENLINRRLQSDLTQPNP